VRLSGRSRARTRQTPESRTLRRRAGALQKRQAQKKTACGRFLAEEEAASSEAGQSRGVVRAPRRSHLPAVRAVWGFRAGVVERAKTALLGSETQIVPLFQEKQRGCAQNWRNIGMASNKIKFPLWLTSECKQVVEKNYREDQCQSRSEFIEKAIWFYAGFLHTLDAGAYLPRALKQMLDGTLGVFAERIGRQLFKLAVEQNVNNHILASDTDIDAARYMKMHTLSMDQVRGTNGKISFVDVLQQEKAL